MTSIIDLENVVYLLIPTSNHNGALSWSRPHQLYIFWFLHQTTTTYDDDNLPLCCISFDSYIKPQLKRLQYVCLDVVYLLIPTSNHNSVGIVNRRKLLYIFWFLHQTTTCCDIAKLYISCISFDSYIKPQLVCCANSGHERCISFDSYIKPQLCLVFVCVRICCISFDSYIKPQQRLGQELINSVVYLLIPTSNHNGG